MCFITELVFARHNSLSQARICKFYIYFFSSLGPFPNILRQVEIETISNDICNQITVYGGAVSSGMICAGFLSGKFDACEVRIKFKSTKMNLLNKDDLTNHRPMSFGGTP